jgi:hypothetical protein
MSHTCPPEAMILGNVIDSAPVSRRCGRTGRYRPIPLGLASRRTWSATTQRGSSERYDTRFEARDRRGAGPTRRNGCPKNAANPSSRATRRTCGDQTMMILPVRTPPEKIFPGRVSRWITRISAVTWRVTPRSAAGIRHYRRLKRRRPSGFCDTVVPHRVRAKMTARLCCSHLGRKVAF